MVKLAVQIEGIGILGPGMDSWTGSVAMLDGRSPYIRQPTVVPVPEGLPPAERRRIGLVVKLALSVALQATLKAGVEPDALPAVFASSGGDGQNCHEICQALSHDERMISPTRFHNSVHNAAAGYWSIATRSRAASNAVCAFDWSFAAGLLEAVTQVVVDQTRVLLVAFDAPYPQPLHGVRTIPEAFGAAFVLAPFSRVARRTSSERESSTREPSTHAEPAAPNVAGGSFGSLTLEISDSPADRMNNAELEALRASVPAARALPVLRQLALRKQGVVNVEYIDGRSLAVEVEPCT